MTPFTCIDSTTGEVLFKGMGDSLEAVTSPGTLALEEIAPDNTYRDLVSNIWVQIPSQPSTSHEWDWNTKEWVDPRTLQSHKADRVQALRQAREEVIAAGFTWDGSAFDSDMKSQTRLLGLRVKAMSDPGMSEQWRLQDNTWRTLSATDAMGVWGALEQHIRQAFITFSVLEAQVLAASSIEQVSTISWT
jgi:Domain of unknown function (DUF4376)